LGFKVFDKSSLKSDGNDNGRLSFVLCEEFDVLLSAAWRRSVRSGISPEKRNGWSASTIDGAGFGVSALLSVVAA
jgi:hypothetical protein